MNFRQVEVFKAVMETGTVTGAARRLYVSQPAASKLLAQLERDLGFRAFERIKGRLVPTAEARALYGQVERAYTGMDYLKRYARDLREMRRGHLVIAVMPALSPHWMPSVVARFLREHPGITVSLHVRTSAKVLEWVAGQQVDVGIAMLAMDDPLVQNETLWECEAVCVLPPGHRLGGRDVIQATDLADEPFVSLGSVDHSRQIIDRVMERCGVRRRLEVDTVLSATACALVAEGLGVSIVDLMTARDYERHGVLVRLFRPRIAFPVRLLRPLHRAHSVVADSFIEHLKHCAEVDGWAGGDAGSHLRAVAGDVAAPRRTAR